MKSFLLNLCSLKDASDGIAFDWGANIAFCCKNSFSPSNWMQKNCGTGKHCNLSSAPPRADGVSSVSCYSMTFCVLAIRSFQSFFKGRQNLSRGILLVTDLKNTQQEFRRSISKSIYRHICVGTSDAPEARHDWPSHECAQWAPTLS